MASALAAKWRRHGGMHQWQLAAGQLAYHVAKAQLAGQWHVWQHSAGMAIKNGGIHLVACIFIYGFGNLYRVTLPPPNDLYEMARDISGVESGGCRRKRWRKCRKSYQRNGMKE